MPSYDVQISRSVLQGTHKAIRATFPDVKPMKQAWVYMSHGDYWEGHVKPFRDFEAFYWSGKADNAYDARQKTWFEWNSKHKAIEFGEAEEE